MSSIRDQSSGFFGLIFTKFSSIARLLGALARLGKAPSPGAMTRDCKAKRKNCLRTRKISAGESDGAKAIPYFPASSQMLSSGRSLARRLESGEEWRSDTIIVFHLCNFSLHHLQSLHRLAYLPPAPGHAVAGAKRIFSASACMT